MRALAAPSQPAAYHSNASPGHYVCRSAHAAVPASRRSSAPAPRCLPVRSARQQGRRFIAGTPDGFIDTCRRVNVPAGRAANGTGDPGHLSAQPSRGKTTTNAAIADEIEELHRAIDGTDRGGPSLDERIGAAIAKLEEAERHVRAHGLFARFGGGLDQQRRYDQWAVIGALMLTSRKQLTEAETSRARAAFDAAGGIGMTDAERHQRLTTLRAELRKLHARREIAWRAEDSDEAFAARPWHRCRCRRDVPFARRRLEARRRREAGRMTSDDDINTDYGWTDFETGNAIGVVRACFAAGRPDMIEQMLFDHVSAKSVPQLLAARAAAMAAVAPPPAAVTPHQPPAPRPTAQEWSDVMAAAQARFLAQAPQQAPQRAPQSGR